MGKYDVSTVSILHSPDSYVEMLRLQEVFRKHYPESIGWVMIKYYTSTIPQQIKWTFTNISGEYRWMKRRLEAESMATVGKTFRLFPSEMGRFKSERPVWSVSEEVMDRMVAEGEMFYNDEKTAAYPTRKMYAGMLEENMGNGQ